MSNRERKHSFRRDLIRLKRICGHLRPAWIILAISIVLGTTLISLHFAGSPTVVHQHKVTRAPNSPDPADTFDRFEFGARSIGVVFPVVIAMVTVVGFLLGLAKLEEFLGQATSLRSFLEKAAEIMDDCNQRNDKLWVVCHSPLIGNLSERDSKQYGVFEEKLFKTAKNESLQLKIVGLSPAQLGKYYQKFANDKRYDPRKCKDAFKETQDILLQLLGAKNHNEYLAVEEESEFFLVASEYQAVVASALFLPSEQKDASSRQGQQREQEKDNAQKPEKKKVQLIGFMTRDGNTIDALLDAFDFAIKNSRRLTEASEVTDAIRTWPDGEDLATVATNGNEPAAQPTTLVSPVLPQEPQNILLNARPVTGELPHQGETNE